MKFSVILATRNRPEEFRVALDSVLAQQGVELEVIVVNDGSDADHIPAYNQIETDRLGGSKIHHLPKAMNGHGQSYVLNFGAAMASGEVLGFLDDDDEWTDNQHLSRAAQTIQSLSSIPDLYFTCQRAFFGDTQKTEEIWLDGLEQHLPDEKKVSGNSAFSVTVTDLLKATGFAHVNNTLIRKDHFVAIKGFDETLRYECDRDFYLRAVDAADTMVYTPDFVSRHNIPDPTAGTSMSTLLGDIDKRLYQLRVLDKAICFSRHAALRNHGRTHKAFALQKLAGDLEEAGRTREAYFYAREASLLRPSLSASAAVVRLGLKRMVGR